MTLLWTAPRLWVTKDPITKEKLNAISDDLNYLFSPSMGLVTVRGTNADVTTASTTPVEIDDANLALSVETAGRQLRIKLEGQTFNNTLAAFNRFDVLIDNTTYLSSLTGTQLASGVASTRQYVASNEIHLNMDIVVPVGVLAAGVHTFKPRWWVSGGTGTFRFATGYFAQFYVGEF